MYCYIQETLLASICEIKYEKYKIESDFDENDIFYNENDELL